MSIVKGRLRLATMGYGINNAQSAQRDLPQCRGEKSIDRQAMLRPAEV